MNTAPTRTLEDSYNSGIHMVEAKGCLFLPCSLAVTITPHMVEGTPERS